MLPDPRRAAAVGEETDGGADQLGSRINSQSSRGVRHAVGGSRLLDVLTEAREAVGCSMLDLTVLSPQNDPFRIDTPASHRDGQWLADTSRELGLDGGTIHLRGTHYAVMGTIKPNGQPYENTDADWTWLSQKAAKAARWLGYIAFDRIVDQRNTPPTVREAVAASEPDSWIGSGSMYVEFPETVHLSPRAHADGFVAVQPIRLALVGEKSSLEPVLAPLADRYDTDLFLPTGEASDTMIHTMASAADDDGRRLVVLYFADCDPAGWQMPISVARKLQALQAGFFPDLDFEVRSVALTPDQVREYGLPSTPLKDTERRGDRWREQMEVEQTEIDALAALQPDLLRRIARDAIAPFYDHTLAERVRDAHHAWYEAARVVLDESVDADHVARLEAEATRAMASFRAEIAAINRAARIDTTGIDLPEIVVPDAALDHPPDDPPLIDSAWTFANQSRRLRAAKAYEVAS